MSPPYTMLRADPSWDTIDLALPKTATAARAALKHAKKRYEDVLQQLEELLEYEQRHQQQFHHHHNHQQKNSSTSVSPVTATASSRSHQNQHQQQQNEAPNKTAHDDYSIADDNFTPTPERLRHESDNHHQNQQQENSTSRTNNDSAHHHQYSPKQISMTDHRIVFTSVFNPVPRHVCSSSVSASRPVDPSDLNPRPTTRLRCGTASFVYPHAGTSTSQHQHQTTTSSSSVTTTTTKTTTIVNNKNNNKNSASPIQNELVQINRSVSSQRRGSIDHYYYHGLPSANNNENEKKQEEEEEVDESDQTQLPMNHSSPSPRNPKNKKKENKVATIETHEEAEEEIDVYDACEKFQEQYEKPARTDSASPLSYQRRPLHHHKASASSSPSRRLKITSMARKHQRDVFVLNNNENSMSLQRGFSLKNISSSPSPRIRSHNMRGGGGGVDDVDTGATMMIKKGEGSIRRCHEKNLFKTQQQQLTNSSSTTFYDTVIVFGIASVFVTAALKFNIVEL